MQSKATSSISRGVGWDYFLVEAEAGDVGFFDDVGIVTLGFVEGEGEVLDEMLGAELHEEIGKVSHFGGEPFYIVGRGDSAEQQHVVGEMGGSACGRQDYERHGKGCIFRGKTGAVGVVLIAELSSLSAVVVGEIFLDVGDGCFQPRIAYDGDVGGRFCACCGVGDGRSLAAEDGFYTSYIKNQIK